MKKFLCLCYYDHPRFETMTKSDIEALQAACVPHDAALHATGRLAFVASIAAPEKARVIRPGADDAPTVSDGPYAKTNEPVGAMLIVDAEDLDEAVTIAMKHPSAHIGKLLAGGIEVRELEYFEQP